MKVGISITLAPLLLCPRAVTGRAVTGRAVTGRLYRPLSGNAKPTTVSACSTSEELKQRACFGAGCFWGTEKFFAKDFRRLYPSRDITGGKVGYMGKVNSIKDPSYKQVCSGQTGHVEVYDFNYAGGDDTYELLCRHFFSFHDPTTIDRQGYDSGTQYASVINCYTDEQIYIAEKVKKDFQMLLDNKIPRYSGSSIVTDVRKATTFYTAEPEHQLYLEKNPGGYCNHFYRVDISSLPDSSWRS